MIQRGPSKISSLMLTHLLELRQRIIYILIWFGVLSLSFFLIADDLLALLIKPLLQYLPEQSSLIATEVTAPIFMPLKMAIDCAMLLSFPCALYHLWQFISPGLYKKEQKFLRGAIVASILLFFIGMLFCFFLILPFMFQFFVSALPKDIRLMPDMTHTLDFIIRMLMLFGLCFQVPLICSILVRTHIVEVNILKNIRPYVIVAAFIIGMLLTPPDVFSQLMLAIPLCLLYELGILFSKIK
jgi:sec-independent protein translocase protein TatC